ncbi:hypothetical protein PoB_001416900 [Plakobranchus ocellatus]|uniref:Uncharacterized protein n=1 Tax=Plakobranchus ocellatus TaxID=259542 RepID=A0AAV3YZT6_9GAST|nr:hypothetical protein PoB_001416900 [Plakobranchus ocellatus]
MLRQDIVRKYFQCSWVEQGLFSTDWWSTRLAPPAHSDIKLRRGLLSGQSADDRARTSDSGTMGGKASKFETH